MIFLANETYYSTINPSLERQARLNMSYGLYQVRGSGFVVMTYPIFPS
jgi:alkyl sulfatase BDS1-like metallo-beta-lactamase superfamily hydrolase